MIGLAEAEVISVPFGLGVGLGVGVGVGVGLGVGAGVGVGVCDGGLLLLAAIVAKACFQAAAVDGVSLQYRLLLPPDGSSQILTKATCAPDPATTEATLAGKVVSLVPAPTSGSANGFPFATAIASASFSV